MQQRLLFQFRQFKSEHKQTTNCSTATILNYAKIEVCKANYHYKTNNQLCRVKHLLTPNNQTPIAKHHVLSETFLENNSRMASTSGRKNSHSLHTDYILIVVLKICLPFGFAIIVICRLKPDSQSKTGATIPY